MVHPGDLDIFSEGFSLPDRPQTLQGRLAIVTGSTRGIGLATTLHLAAHGCAVIGTFVRSQEISDRLSAALPSFHGVAADITTPTTSVPGILSALAKHHSTQPVDIIINNAALSSLAPLFGETYDNLRAVYTANVIFPTLLVQALLPHLSKTGTGRIVNISSEATHFGRPNSTAYSGSKAALESLTRTWAKELGREYGGLTVNSLAVGMTETDLWRNLPQHRKEFWLDKAEKEVPVDGRIGRAGDVAEVVGWLVGAGGPGVGGSSVGGAWVSGQVLSVSGGNLMMV